MVADRPTSAASALTVREQDLRLRPIQRVSDLLRVAPGLITIQHAGGGKAGIALSDPFCVDRHRADFRRLVKDEMDYVIGNQHEWCSLYQTEDLEAALFLAHAECPVVVCTRSGEDVILLRGQERVEVPVHRVVPVDATGAGDQFAAGGAVGGLLLKAWGPVGLFAACGVAMAAAVLVAIPMEISR